MPIPLGPFRLALAAIHAAVDRAPHLDRRGRRDHGPQEQATIEVTLTKVRAWIRCYSTKGEALTEIVGRGVSVEAAVEDLDRAIGER